MAVSQTSNAATNLEYHNLMLKEVVHSDCLVVSSPGLGIERLLIQLLQVYSESGRIVFILSSSTDLEDYCRSQLEDLGLTVNRLPKTITFDVNIAERLKLYSSGGCFFITSRILVVDMLSNRVPWHSMSGIIVLNAHSIIESHQDAFCLRLFRMNNTSGFIKGLTSNPQSLSKGLMSLDRVMRTLFVKEVFVWNRNRKQVIESLESRAKPNVVEIRFNLTPDMESIQFAIMDLIDMLLRDLKGSNPGLFNDADEVSLENAITPNFSRLLRRQFEPVWHQLTPRTKRILDDMNVLRRLLFSLTDDDCLTFYDLLQSIRHSIKLDTRISDWIFYEPAETLFVVAKNRLGFKKKTNTGEDDLEAEPDLETNPKWVAFCDIVKEVKEETKTLGREVTLLVIIRADSMAEKLTAVLEKGAEQTLKELYFRRKKFATKQDESSQEVERVNLLDKSCVSLSEVIEDYNEFCHQTVKKSHVNILYHSTQASSYIDFEKILQRYKPWFFVMYDPDVESIRRLEVYQAVNCSPDQSRIYFLIFDSSAEEQRYLTVLRKEKDAFELLLSSVKNLVIPEERDGKSGLHPDLERSSQLLDLVSNKRKSLSKKVSRNDIIKQRVVVDLREFRCQLPSLLHKRGIDIDAETIDIGDYILTPDVCVERKSLIDLIGSLSSGRLYNQTRVMTRFYRKPVLLIEFDERQDFGLKGKMSFQWKGFSSSQDKTAGSVDTTRKLVLLTISFPKLRVIWSPSPAFSAEIFELLKMDREQPVLKKVMDISSEELPVEELSDSFDIEAKDFLLSLPGVNYHNVFALMTKFMNIMEILKASKDELSKVLDSKISAESLYSCLHNDLANYCVNTELKVEKQKEKQMTKQQQPKNIYKRKK